MAFGYFRILSGTSSTGERDVPAAVLQAAGQLGEVGLQPQTAGRRGGGRLTLDGGLVLAHLRRGLGRSGPTTETRQACERSGPAGSLAVGGGVLALAGGLGRLTATFLRCFLRSLGCGDHRTQG